MKIKEKFKEWWKRINYAEPHQFGSYLSPIERFMVKIIMILLIMIPIIVVVLLIWR